MRHTTPVTLKSFIAGMSTSTHTISSLPRLSATDLSALLLSLPRTSTSNLDAAVDTSKIAIIDVRDDDHVGGHIKHSTHIPSATLDYKIPELVRKLQDKEIVVFHCALSQQRGPGAALRYLGERERLLGGGSGGTVGTGEKMKMSKKDVEGENRRDDPEAEWEDISEEKGQKVYVLDRGFVGWQERFGEDPRLTEGYRKEIWKDGYWM